MMNNNQKTSILYKAHFNKASTHELRETYEEMFDSYKHLFTDDILTYGSLIPKKKTDKLYTDIARLAKSEGIVYYDESSYKKLGIIKHWVNLQLTPVSPNCNDAFVVMADGEQLRNIIPYDFTEEGWYNYTLSIGGREIPFGINDWVLDTNSAILTFYNGVPAGVSAQNPPSLSFWQYVGPVGERHYLDVVGLETDAIYLNKGESIYDVSEHVEHTVKQISDSFYADHKFEGNDTTQGIGLQYELIEPIIESSTSDPVKGYDSESKSSVVYMLSNKAGKVYEQLEDGSYDTVESSEVFCDFATAGIATNSTSMVKVPAMATVKLPSAGGFVVVTNKSASEKDVEIKFNDSEITKMVLLVKENRNNNFKLFTPRTNITIKGVKVPVFVDLIELPPHLKLNQFSGSYADMVTPQFYGPRTKSYVIADNTSSVEIESSDLVVYSNDKSNLSTALSELPENTYTVYLRDGTYAGTSKLLIKDITLEGESTNTVITNANVTIENAIVNNVAFENCTISLVGSTLKNCITDKSTTVTTSGMSTIMDTHIYDTLEITEDAFVTSSHITNLDITSETENILVDTTFITHMLRCPAKAKIESSYVVDWSKSSAKAEQHPDENTIPYYKKFNERVFANLTPTLQYNYNTNTIDILVDSDRRTIYIDEKTHELRVRYLSDSETLIEHPHNISTQIEQVYGVHADTKLEEDRPKNVAEAIEDLYWSKADLRDGKVPIDQLPDSVAYGGLAFVGMWSFEDHEGRYPTFEDTNKSAMSDDKYRGLQPGWFFIVKASNIEDDPAAPQYSVDETGERDGREWTAGDWIIWNGEHFDYEFSEGIPATELNNKVLVTTSSYSDVDHMYGITFSHTASSDTLYIFTYDEVLGKNKKTLYTCNAKKEDGKFTASYVEGKLQSFTINDHKVYVRYDRTDKDESDGSYTQYLQFEAEDGDSSEWLSKLPYDLFNKQFVVMKTDKTVAVKKEKTAPAAQVLYDQNGRNYSYSPEKGAYSFGSSGGFIYNLYQGFSYSYNEHPVDCYIEKKGEFVPATVNVSDVVTLVFTADTSSEKFTGSGLSYFTKGKLYIFTGTTFYPKALLHYYDLKDGYYDGDGNPLEASVPVDFKEATATLDVEYVHEYTKDCYNKPYLDHILIEGNKYTITDIYQGTKDYGTYGSTQGYIVLEGDEDIVKDLPILGNKLYAHGHHKGLAYGEATPGKRSCHKLGYAYGSIPATDAVALGTDVVLSNTMLDEQQITSITVTANWVKVDRSYSEPAMARLPELAPYLGENKEWCFMNGGDGLLDLKLKTIAEAFKLVNNALKNIQPGKATSIRNIDIIETNATTAKKYNYYEVKPGPLDTSLLELKEAYDYETGVVGYMSYRDNKNDLDNCFYCGGTSDIVAHDGTKTIDGLSVDRFDPYTKFNLGFQKEVQQAAQFEGVVTLSGQEDYNKIYSIFVDQSNIQPRYESDTASYEGSSKVFTFEARKFVKESEAEVETANVGENNEAHYKELNAAQINEVLTYNKLAGLSYLPFGTLIEAKGTIINAVKYGSIPEDFITVTATVGGVPVEVTSKATLTSTDEKGTYDMTVAASVILDNEEVNSMYGDLIVTATLKDFAGNEKAFELVKLPSVYAIRKEAIENVVSSGAFALPTLSQQNEYDERLFGCEQAKDTIFKNTNELMYQDGTFKWVEPTKVIKNIDNNVINYDEVTNNGLDVSGEEYRYVTFCQTLDSIKDVAGFMVKLDMVEEPQLNEYTGQLKDMTLQVCATDGTNQNLQNANKLIPAYFASKLEADEPCLHSGKSTATDRRISFGRALIPVKEVYVRVGIKKDSNLAIRGIEIH